MENKDEIQLINLLKKVKSYFKLIKSKWLLIAFFSFLGLSIGVLMPKNPKYHSKVSISLNINPSKGGLMNIASSLGLGGDSEIISYDKFETIISSQKLIEDVLFDSISVNNKFDLLINHLVILFNYEEEWKIDRPHLLQVNMTQPSSEKDTIISLIIPEFKNILSINEGKGDMIEITCQFKNEQVCLKTPVLFAKKGIDFFLNKRIRKDLHTKDVLKLRLDSISLALNTAEQYYSLLKDRSHRTVKMTSKLELLKSQRQVSLLNEIYLQLVKQLEMINFKISNTQIGLELVDLPRPPLFLTQTSLPIRAITGFVLGFCSIVFSVIAFQSLSNLRDKL